jgi:hypothetical protein
MAISAEYAAAIDREILRQAAAGEPIDPVYLSAASDDVKRLVAVTLSAPTDPSSTPPAAPAAARQPDLATFAEHSPELVRLTHKIAA